jgi:hypothetical protein
MEKGDDIMVKVADNSVEYLAWGASLAKDQRESARSIMQQNMAILGYVMQNFERYERKELFNYYYDLYVQYATVR